MNPEQVKSGVRYLLATFGGAVAGWFASRGWLSTEQVLSILNSEVFLGLIVSGIMGAWGLVARTNKNMVVAANNVPAVRGVVMHPTSEGKAIASAVPTDSVTVAGTTTAKELVTP